MSSAEAASWYAIGNIDQLDSPALVVYKERVWQNIQLAVGQVQNVGLLRPHVKTSKISEICGMLQEAGITKFKCATIAEAEMLALIRAPDVLLAYQPVGPKVARLAALVRQYPQTRFSCLVDNAEAATRLSDGFAQESLSLDVFIDLNVGMNRSGLPPGDAPALLQKLEQLPALHTAGLHAYDGHIHDPAMAPRKQKAVAVFEEVFDLAARLEEVVGRPLRIVAGGSPTFMFYRERPVECSPGTFVFWDWGYHQLLPEEPYRYAALVITRVVSVVDATTLTLDLGHKSVAAENPLPRVHFLNAPDAKPVAQSEEHLVVKVPDSRRYHTGDVLYGVPVHICPTVALYDTAVIIEGHQATGRWKVIARDRSITV